MKKFTKQLLTGIIALGMLAPIATMTISPIQTTVNASHHYHYKKRAKKIYKIKLHNVKLIHIPRWLRGHWLNTTSYHYKIAYIQSFVHYNQYNAHNRHNHSNIRGAFFRVYKHGHATHQFIAITNTINMTKHNNYYLIESPSKEITHVFPHKRYILLRSNINRKTEYYYNDNGRFVKLTHRQYQEITNLPKE